MHEFTGSIELTASTYIITLEHDYENIVFIVSKSDRESIENTTCQTLMDFLGVSAYGRKHLKVMP
jgi:hypothetical protein